MYLGPAALEVWEDIDKIRAVRVLHEQWERIAELERLVATLEFERDQAYRALESVRSACP
jgi:hypothetical protein